MDGSAMPSVKQEPVDWSESVVDGVQLSNKDSSQCVSSAPEFIACAQEEHVVKLEMLTEPDITEPLGGIAAEVDRRLQLEQNDSKNQSGNNDNGNGLTREGGKSSTTTTSEDTTVTSVNKLNKQLKYNVSSIGLPSIKSCDEPKLSNNNNNNNDIDNKAKLKVVSINKLKEFHCPTCEKSFSKLLHLEKHLAKKCEEKVFNCLEKTKSFLCEICSKVLTTRSGLIIHLRGHGERAYSCQVCHKKFLLRVQLRDHSRLHSGERPFECAVCHKSYTRKACLKVHVMKHTGEMPYRCDLCHKRFSRKYNLLKHLQSHSGDRPFACNLCSKRFKSKQNLEAHYRVHSARSMLLHACNICQENFSTKIRLTRHKVREHSGYRPFTCHICRKPFIFKSQLTSHYKEHNIQKPFSCSKCHKSYVRQAHLVTHIKVHCSDFVPIPPEVKIEVIL